MLEILGTGSMPGEVIVSAGTEHTADWYRDLQAHRGIEVALTDHRFRPLHRGLNEIEAVAVLTAYEQLHRWAAPLLGHRLSWRYDGSEHARHRLARELTLVAFRPDNAVTRRGH